MKWCCPLGDVANGDKLKNGLIGGHGACRPIKGLLV